MTLCYISPSRDLQISLVVNVYIFVYVESVAGFKFGFKFKVYRYSSMQFFRLMIMIDTLDWQGSIFQYWASDFWLNNQWLLQWSLHLSNSIPSIEHSCQLEVSVSRLWPFFQEIIQPSWISCTGSKVPFLSIQGPPNLRFMLEKVQKGDFLKKLSRKLNFFCFRFKWIPWRPGTLN